MPKVDLAKLGYEALDQGLFDHLTQRYPLTYAFIGERAGLQSTSVRDWVKGRRRPNHAQAARLGRWYLEAIHEAERFAFGGEVDLGEWVPMATALQYLGMSRQSLLQKCRTGQIASLDLGPLGFYVHRSEVTTMKEVA